MKKNELWAKRSLLIDQLPLDTPLGIHVCASSYCNFRCSYCPHVHDDDKEGNPLTKNIKYALMNMDTFKRIINQMKAFSQRTKCLNFAWYGEPLTNPEIADFVELAKREEVADVVSITTNASLLDSEMSNRLIEAGLDRIRISLQGLDTETYLKVGGVRVDFEEIVNNIRYFHDIKKHTDVYVKIVDSLVSEAGEEERFHRIFDDISDYVNVECLEPLQNNLDLSPLKDSFDSNYYGGYNTDSQTICSYCFYQIIISPQGDIYPCCSLDFEEVDDKIRDMRLSNIWDDTLYDYWNGDRLRDFRLSQIQGNRFSDSICARCEYPQYHIADEDRLDNYVDRMKTIYKI